MNTVHHLRRVLVVAGALLLASAAASARAQDQIDLNQVVVHDSPLDVASWPITARITRVTETPGQSGGLGFETSPTLPGSWQVQTFPQDHPSTGMFCAPPGGTDGCIQYTVWALAKIGGVWHAAGFIQMWLGRASTGAPMLAQFHSDWAYACDRWPVLCTYHPQGGDQMAFFLSAGNARDFRDVSSVRERTNVVVITVPASDAGEFRFSADDVPPPSGPVPPTPPASAVDLTARVQSLEGAVALLINQFAAANANVVEAVRLVSALVSRVTTLEAKPIPTSCSAAANLGFTRIPVSCRLNP